MEKESQADIAKLVSMIKKIDFGMLTTVAADGSLHSRPMSVNGKVEQDGDLWFFTYADSLKVIEAQQKPQVNVSFSDVQNNKYVSVSGTAHLVKDKAKIAQLWEPELKAWFPQGQETPGIALLRISAKKAEFWDEPSAIVAQSIALFKSLTGEPIEVGDNKKVDLSASKA